MPIPHLQPTPTGKQLIVDDKPFLMLAGELQNSSMSSAEYMRTVWQKLTAASVNTVLGAVQWEQIEPEEGKFDFAELDQVIFDARQHGLRLVLLWFGSFKNATSIYTPGWVKTNQKRFPRARLRQAGGRIEIADTLSVFQEEGPAADARAFTKLMEHIMEIDEQHSTVIMVQVENECGIRGDSRDGSRLADARYYAPVPQDLLSFLSNDWENLHPSLKANLQHSKFKTTISDSSKNKSWESVFGTGAQTDELFMAYHYARYVEKVTSAGKAAYPLPMYANVWQNYKGEDKDLNFKGVVVAGGGAPGEYPSGGGVANVLDVWQQFAPSLDFVAPDVYLNDYVSSCRKYRHRNQPLFIPEQRRDEYGARRVWAAYGTYAALGTAPFGIDTLDPATNPFKLHYGLLAQMAPYVLAAQARPNASFGFFFDELAADGSDPSPPITTFFGDWVVRVERSFVFGRPGPGFGMIIHQGGARFLLIGSGFQLVFSSRDPGKTFTGILRYREKIVVGPGELADGRVLNGDETRTGKLVIMPGEDPDYGGYPICVTIPARTRVAEVEIYALGEEENDDDDDEAGLNGVDGPVDDDDGFSLVERLKKQTIAAVN
ncbi:hypothetical protein A1O1_08846 [Capronia coronata CBS 617.96]|uniref:Beta-galactosidase n=1 Tax=Capronia coronata CBS 617.96 TaxID=1182541 RepID=W9XNC1_9EURO|nr:uncharacterized protein A1O1_08846 [Capronia coronata CBS 617.96]EXJ78446.1 hypothetical protein A1O1_08846 [Capronia coronata CBS 617.96]